MTAGCDVSAEPPSPQWPTLPRKASWCPPGSSARPATFIWRRAACWSALACAPKRTAAQMLRPNPQDRQQASKPSPDSDCWRDLRGVDPHKGRVGWPLAPNPKSGGARSRRPTRCPIWPPRGMIARPGSRNKKRAREALQMCHEELRRGGGSRDGQIPRYQVVAMDAHGRSPRSACKHACGNGISNPRTWRQAVRSGTSP
jgi:hypothetical protein